MIKKIFFLIILFFAFSSFSQEERIINGVVLDTKTNNPLPSASILIKGTKKGAVTNFNGKFAYKVKSKTNIKDIILVVKFIGYKSKEVKLGKKSYFVIKLQEDVANLDEIIITSSYGTSKLKQDVVGSIENIKTKDIIPEQVATSFDQLLEGQVAGVYIESGNQLGEEIKINVRGQGSLTQLNNNAVGTSTQPLIIVDGVILSEETGLDGNNFFDAGNGLLSENILNPLARIGIQDIKSFNILKDAAAVGLYGADAANGVIIITTKSGKKGKVKFNASIQSGVSSPFNQFKYLNGEQYQTVRNIYNQNSGNLDAIEPWNGVDTDWHNLLNGIGTYSNYNLGFSGGIKNWTYRTSVGYQINNESQINNNLKRLNTSINIGYKKDTWSANIRFSPSIVTKNTPNTLANFAVQPTLAPFNDNGNYTFIDTFGNPLAVANQNKNEVVTKAFITSISLNYNILDNLKFSTLFGMDFSLKNEDRFFSGKNGTGDLGNKSITNPQDPNGPKISVPIFGRRMLRERNTNKWNWNANITFDKIFNKKHTFNALLGVEARSDTDEFGYRIGAGFSNFSTPQSLDKALIIDEESDSNTDTGLSLFSQLNYDFEKKYYFLVNFRIDQSSAFGTDKNTAFNGGIGSAWVISNEDFFKSNVIDFLKLRVSYGSTGNSRIGSYRSLGLYTVDNEGNDGYNGFNYANTTSPPNPNLGWERNIKANIGLDFNFLNKFSATLEYYRDLRKDIITSRDAIPETGFNNVQINGAEMINQGIEFSIQANWIKTKKINWSTNFNIATLKNEVTSLSGLGSQFSSAETARAQRIGFATSTIWGYNFLGIDPATGRELYNVNNNIYDASYIAANFNNTNWEPIGDSQPTVFGGFRNSFKYNNFNLAFVFSYAFGQSELLNRVLVDQYRVITNRNINANVFYDAWQNQGDVALYPIIADNNRIISNSSKYLVDASNIKLRSINLSYSLPLKNIKIPLDDLSIFTNVSNVYTWFFSKTADNRNGIAEFSNIYPEMRTISLGVNANF
ncbi:SusC/RagA family TonB-linked outer membrane protein [Polaribacter cellanae]|uniref:SusC/RagA family TonB-linked outer membrane protein n=1 Tax=Polaribacter cellanae TaxID=2818493 RepID=A0A975H5Y9_9FLAO|nr:SusC/RagA family TonB-linked outer membrane protein [Polaribacter cellanae]QTE21433.1 SusC/RagA family TonB-linked outer membrane protein [Polaribacter cellanae]